MVSVNKQNMKIHNLNIGYQKIHVSQSANPLKWRFLINFFYCVQIRKFNMYLLKVAITFVELKKAGSWQTQNQKFHWSLWNSTFLTKLSGIDLHVSYEFLLVVLTKTSYQTLAKTMGGRPDCNMKFLAWAPVTKPMGFGPRVPNCCIVLALSSGVIIQGSMVQILSKDLLFFLLSKSLEN